MGMIQRSQDAHCTRCGHKTRWFPQIGHIGVLGEWHICLKCSECGMLVPDYGWREYVRKGYYQTEPRK